MDWENLILHQLSRKLVDHLIQQIEENPALFDELFPYIYSNNQRLAWRTGWILCHLQNKAPHFLEAKLEEMITHLPQTPFHGVRRSLLYIIFNSKYEDFSVEFINQCFEWMLSPKQDPAIQVYCMYNLHKVCKVYPDFKPELIACLENMEPFDYSNGFNAARIKTLLKLRKGR